MCGFFPNHIEFRLALVVWKSDGNVDIEHAVMVRTAMVYQLVTMYVLMTLVRGRV